MVTIVTRAGKGERLTHDEVDANFTALAEAVNAVISVVDYGTVGDGVTDDGPAINAATAAYRATLNSVNETYIGWVSGGGRRYRVTSSVNFTNFRPGAASLRDITLLPEMTGGNVLDMTDTHRAYVTDVNISNDGLGDSTPTGTANPDVGILQQRNGDGRVAGNNRLYRCIVNGTYNDAALVNYASEECTYYDLFLGNDKRDEAASCLHIQCFTTAPGQAFPSAFQTNATGARSNIRALFTSVNMNRQNNTGWEITGISKAATAVFSYTLSTNPSIGAVDPVVGDVFALSLVNSIGDAGSTWPLAINNYVLTIASVDTGAKTFTVTKAGVALDTSGLTGTYDTASSPKCFYKTGPGLRVVHRDRLQIEHFYIATTGSHGIEIAYGGNKMRDVQLHGHIEGDALQAWAKFICGTTGTAKLEIVNLSVMEHASHISEDFFKTNATTGKVIINGLKMWVGDFRADPTAPGEANATMRGHIFDDPSKYYIYDADIELPNSTYMNDIKLFGHFSGVIRYADTGERLLVGGNNQTATVTHNDDFLGGYGAPWTIRAGTDVDNVITFPNQRGGVVSITMGNDAATLAASGNFITTPEIFRAGTAAPLWVYGSFHNLTNNDSRTQFIGLSSDTSALIMPCEMATPADDTVTAAVADLFGLLWDTNQATEGIRIVARANSGAVAVYNTGIVPSNDAAAPTTFQFLGALADAGNRDINVAINGSIVTTMVGALRAGVDFGKIAGGYNRGGGTRQMRLDYFNLNCLRGY